MITITHVTKKFRNITPVKDVSLCVPEGCIVGIIGKNGSGKTVLFKMICGLMLPTEGSIEVNGERIGKDVDFPSSLGAMIETPGFLSWQTAYQCLSEVAYINKKIGRREIMDAIKLVGLNPDSKMKVGKYSLGMKQRLGIAQAIMEDPDVLVLDEPMNALDEHGVEDVRKILLERKEQGKTILIASHNKDDIEILCDKVYRMQEGVLTEIK